MSGMKRSYGNGHNHYKRPRVTLVTGYDRSAGGLTRVARVPLQKAVDAAVRKTVEKKGMDTSLAVTGPILNTTNTNGDAIVVDLVQQGAGSWNRVGRKINLKSLRVRGVVTWTYTNQAVTGDIVGNTLRMVVVWDKQPSGNAIPTFDTVFGITAQDGTESSTFLAPVKYDNMDRFSVLRDVVMDFKPRFFNGAGGTTDLQIEARPFDEYIELKNREVVFLGQTNPMTIADISTGALYVYFRALAAINDVNDLAINAVSFARLRYIDP